MSVSGPSDDDAAARFDAAMACVKTGVRLPSEVDLPPELLDALDAIAFAVHHGQPADELIAAAHDLFGA